MQELIQKYDVPVPRYTSFPTVPAWKTENFSSEQWQLRVKEAFGTDGEGLSLYIHLPYCESLCTYCGCNTRITVNHKVEEPYIQALISEWRQYVALFGQKPLIREIHLGGGTPTFFSAGHLATLISAILEDAIVHPDHEFSFEGHPNNTEYEHLETLYNLGFRRVSFGIQDVDYKVQKTINRVQKVADVVRVTEWARTLGYESVNFDLIYGLPFQTIRTMSKTMELVGLLQPDRIAFYSYAHVPWTRPGQRAYSEQDLPKAEEKRALNDYGHRILTQMGYRCIGMDHFALETDALWQAEHQGQLHRNFMGYTTTQSELLIGLGTSAISDIGTAYAQNVKSVEGYLKKIEEGGLAVFKGHLMTAKEKEVKQRIINLACTGVINPDMLADLSAKGLSELDHMEKDSLLEAVDGGYLVTDLGRQFIRNVCAVFDPYYEGARSNKVFSQAV